MFYCKTCVNPSTRPRIQFTADGICMVCKNRDVKIDWKARKAELDDIVTWAKGESKQPWDCIVGVSGGKDSTRQALYARDVLGMNPLLVCVSYPAAQGNARGAYNLNNLVSHGFDLIHIKPNPVVWKIMMREAFLKFGNWAKSTELALYAAPVQFALNYRIPLLFLGENPAYTIGESETLESGGDATGMQHSNTLQGGTPDPIMPIYLTQKDVALYRYPLESDIRASGLRIIYIGYYIENFGMIENTGFSVKRGLHIKHEPPEDIGDIIGSCQVDEDWVPVNQLLRYIKLGHATVTDQCINMIHAGIINRQQAIELVEKYDGKCHPKYITSFCQYLEITEEKFWETVEQFRNKELFEYRDGEWRLKVRVGTIHGAPKIARREYDCP